MLLFCVGHMLTVMDSEDATQAPMVKGLADTAFVIVQVSASYKTTGRTE